MVKKKKNVDFEKKDRYRLRPQFLPSVYFFKMPLDCYLVTLAVLPQFCNLVTFKVRQCCYRVTLAVPQCFHLVTVWSQEEEISSG